MLRCALWISLSRALSLSRSLSLPGIDPLKFKETLEKPGMEAILEEYKREFKGRKVLLGIDRLDYSQSQSNTMRMTSEGRMAGQIGCGICLPD